MPIEHRLKKPTIAALLSSTALMASPAAAQVVAEPTGNEIIVTAQKRSENVQDVPISIQVLGTENLEQHQVASFDDYAKLLPNVSFQSFGPGQAQIYFRGISSGGDGLHIGPMPTASIYLDDIPVTTIAGAVDIHMYDIQRVEALAGPQGTLYGASSLAGTLRIITNKPDTTGFYGAIDAEANIYGDGEPGGAIEGFINAPLAPSVALRVVGFYRRDGGYIDNIPGTRTYSLGDTDPTTNLTVDNDALVEKDFNDVETYGGRIALGIDLNDSWTVTPQLIYQRQLATGPGLFDPRKGDLVVTDYLPTINKDRWYQAALTIQGKISDWDLTYAGGYFERSVDSVADYSYYTVAYDTLAGYYYTYFPDGSGGFLDPTQNVRLGDDYTKHTHELRIASPAGDRFRLVAGVFFQRQTDDIRADYEIAGISGIPTPPTTVPVVGFGDSVFHTSIFRVDRDYAAFAEAGFDITDTIELTAGIRGFIAKNTIYGFSGFQSNAENPICLPPATDDRPCTNVDKSTKGSGETHKVSLSWKISPDAMVYATYSTGYRPGGTNRRPGILPFKADTLSNFELGVKTTLLDRMLRLNGAVYYLDWKDLQFGLSPLGSLGVTNTYNAGDARVYGVEGDATLSVGGLTLSAAATYIDAKLTTDFCEIDASGNSVCDPGTPPAAPAGTRLPVQPKFKAVVTARYEFPLGSADAFAQGSMQHQGSTRSFLTVDEFASVGPTDPFTAFDFSFGVEFENWHGELFVQNAFDKRGQLSLNTACATTFCGPYARIYPIKPQLFGIKVGTKF